MKKARLRALTHSLYEGKLFAKTVEMKKARLRALTHKPTELVTSFMARRNEESPTEGIDTNFFYFLLLLSLSVEMK